MKLYLYIAVGNYGSKSRFLFIVPGKVQTGFLKRKYFNSNFVIPLREVANVCSVGGALNLDIEELKWIKYRCNNCGKVYKSSGKKLVCPGCKSDSVVPV